MAAAILATGPGAAIAGSSVGTMAGAAMGAAIPIALVAAAGVGIALAFKATRPRPRTAGAVARIGTAVGEQIAGGTLDELEQSRAALAKGIEDINNVPLGGFLYGDQIRDLQAQLDAVDAEILARASNTGEGIPEAIGEGVAAGTPGAVEAFDEFGDEIAEVGKSVGDKVVAKFGLSMVGVKAAAKVAGTEGMLALAAGITAARQAPLDAFDTLKEMLKNAMTPMSEVARLRGQLTSKALAAGLKSGDPAVRAQAVAVAKMAADRLGELAAGGGKAGTKAMAELDKGIRSKIPAVRDAAIAAKAAAVAKLEATKGPAGGSWHGGRQRLRHEHEVDRRGRRLQDQRHGRLPHRWTSSRRPDHGAVLGRRGGPGDLRPAGGRPDPQPRRLDGGRERPQGRRCGDHRQRLQPGARAGVDVNAPRAAQARPVGERRMTHLAMPERWRFKTIDLSTYAVLVRKVDGVDELPALRGENRVVPSIAGRRFARKRMDQHRLTLALWVQSIDAGGTLTEPTNERQLRANLDALYALFGDRTAGALVRVMPDGSERTATAEVVGIGRIEDDYAGQALGVTVDFLLADPSFYGAAVNPSQAIAASPTNFTLTNVGTRGDAPHGA